MRSIVCPASIGSGCRTLAAVFLFAIWASTGRGGIGASIFYPDQGPVPPGVTFTNISESSGTDPVPLYGPPTAFSVGLDFDPMSFTAHGSNGVSDSTDGQLNFTVEGDTMGQLVGIDSVSMSEAGDYSLTGTGTSSTQVFAGAIMRATVTEIDGMAVTPFNLTPVNGSVGFNLVANPGVVQPWSLGLSLNIAAQLTAMGKSFTAGATEVEIVIDNQLLASSENGTNAVIEKKDFMIHIEPNVIPEPATTALLGMGALMAAVAWRRRVIRSSSK